MLSLGTILSAGNYPEFERFGWTIPSLRDYPVSAGHAVPRELSFLCGTILSLVLSRPPGGGAILSLRATFSLADYSYLWYHDALGGLSSLWQTGPSLRTDLLCQTVSSLVVSCFLYCRLWIFPMNNCTSFRSGGPRNKEQD
jgi:hypothetical protein